MIDTLKLSYPYDEILAKKLNEYKIKLQKLSPDGFVIWSKEWVQDHLPSHFAGLRISFQLSKELKEKGFKGCKSLVFFEFSLQKWCSPSGYNNSNTEFDYDYEVLGMWFNAIQDFLQYDFDRSKFEVYRIDLARNYVLEGNVSVEDFLRALEIKFSKHPDGEKVRRFHGSVYYGSRWLTKKIYWKWLEFMQVERKKRFIKADEIGGEGMENGKELGLKEDEKKGITKEEIDKMSRMLRFELSFKRPCLKKAGVTQVYDIERLRERFEFEARKYTTVQKLKDGQNFTNAEYRLIDLCKRYGYNGAKAEFLKTAVQSYFYRVKNSLVTKGVHLECIDNAEWRLDVKQADGVDSREYFLRVA